TSIGRDTILDAGVVVSRSAVWRRCLIGQNAVADHSIVADDAIVDAGTAAYGAVLVGERRRHVSTSPLPAPAEIAPHAGVECWRRLAARSGLVMRLWPVLLDCFPRYVPDGRQDLSLLFQPFGTDTLIERFSRRTSSLTTLPLTVMAPGTADSEEYRRRVVSA